MHWEKENLLFHYVEKWAERKPESEALVFNNDRLSYRQFKEQTDLKVEVNAFDLDESVRALLHFPINHVAADVEIGFATLLAG